MPKRALIDHQLDLLSDDRASLYDDARKLRHQAHTAAKAITDLWNTSGLLMLALSAGDDGNQPGDLHAHLSELRESPAIRRASAVTA